MPIIQCETHGAVEASLVTPYVHSAFLVGANHIAPTLVVIRVTPFDDDYVVNYWADTETTRRFDIALDRVLSFEEFYGKEEFLSVLQPVCHKCFTAWRQAATTS